MSQTIQEVVADLTESAEQQLEEDLKTAWSVEPHGDDESIFFIRVGEKVRVAVMTCEQFKQVCRSEVKFLLDLVYNSIMADDVAEKLTEYLHQTRKGTEKGMWFNVKDCNNNGLFWVNALKLSNALDIDKDDVDSESEVLVANCKLLKVPIYIRSPQFFGDSPERDADTIEIDSDSAISILLKPMRSSVDPPCVDLANSVESKLLMQPLDERFATPEEEIAHNNEFMCAHGVDALQGGQCTDCDVDSMLGEQDAVPHVVSKMS